MRQCDEAKLRKQPWGGYGGGGGGGSRAVDSPGLMEGSLTGTIPKQLHPDSPLYSDETYINYRRKIVGVGSVAGVVVPAAQIWVMRRRPEFYERHFEIINIFTVMASLVPTFPPHLPVSFTTEASRLTFIYGNFMSFARFTLPWRRGPVSVYSYHHIPPRLRAFHSSVSGRSPPNTKPRTYLPQSSPELRAKTCVRACGGVCVCIQPLSVGTTPRSVSRFCCPPRTTPSSW